MAELQRASRQSGATLFVGLVMLLMMTLLGVSAMRMGTTNTQIVGNEQKRNEAEAAANFALDQVVNEVAINATDPAFMASFPNRYNNATVNVDVGIGQAALYGVTLNSPTCLRFRQIPSSQLVQTTNGVDWVREADQPCISGGELSNCVMTLWSMQATATGGDGATTTMYEGVEVRMNLQTAMNLCP